MERCWERQKQQKEESRLLNKKETKGEYYNGGINKGKNPEDDYKGTQ
jgi:hypothetical protein